MRVILFVLASCLLCLGLPDIAQASWYTLAPATMRSGAGTGAFVRRLAANETLSYLTDAGKYARVATLSGTKGFVPKKLLSKRWVRVFKVERRLELMRGKSVVKRYRVALSSFNPTGDKVQRGDGGTPEGRFFIAEMLESPQEARYGARSMRLSYPNVEDARRALAAKLINRRQYLRIVRAVNQGSTPPQRTRLGGSIRIHGGGSRSDWTLGCIALSDPDVVELFAEAHLGMRVDIYHSVAQQEKLDAAGYLSRQVLAGAKLQLREPALYTAAAMKAIRISYPDGDIAKRWAVCTDIVIRALRHAGLDLQALVQEDIAFDRAAYRRQVRRPNPNIDHRRTRTLRVYFQRHLIALPHDKRFQPGDIVLMNTGIDNGTAFDHIGILDETRDAQGLPKVINIWTVGHHTASMDLLGEAYPTIVGHFRLSHPFDYAARP
jgi:uncharacterized protein YijF (DUF1287 family)